MLMNLDLLGRITSDPYVIPKEIHQLHFIKLKRRKTQKLKDNKLEQKTQLSYFNIQQHKLQWCVAGLHNLSLTRPKSPVWQPANPPLFTVTWHAAKTTGGPLCTCGSLILQAWCKENHLTNSLRTLWNTGFGSSRDQTAWMLLICLEG